jgi:hypothetical protein
VPTSSTHANRQLSPAVWQPRDGGHDGGRGVTPVPTSPLGVPMPAAMAAMVREKHRSMTTVAIDLTIGRLENCRENNFGEKTGSDRSLSVGVFRPSPSSTSCERFGRRVGMQRITQGAQDAEQSPDLFTGTERCTRTAASGWRTDPSTSGQQHAAVIPIDHC